VPRKIFVAGEILTAADLQSNAVDQSVMVFNDATARTTAIPSPIEGMVTYLKSPKSVERYNGTAWVSGISGFTASATITATDASWPVPALGSPIVRVTVIGGGGGGGAADTNNGAAGGTSTFNAGGAGTVSAAGGLGGFNGNGSSNGLDGTAGSGSGNEGCGAVRKNQDKVGMDGTGGAITVAYLNLTGISTVNVTIGAGGAGGAAGTQAGGSGGRGEVIVEYVAA
jgi:hypothetical protein